MDGPKTKVVVELLLVQYAQLTRNEPPVRRFESARRLFHFPVFEETSAYLMRRSSPTGIMCSLAGPRARRRTMSIFPTKILLATDGSKDAKLAARTAADLAGKTGSELHIVYVGGEGFYETPLVDLATLEPTWVAREYPDLLSDIELTERELLDNEVEKVMAAGGTVTQAHLSMGKAAPEIIVIAEKIDAGLIVMGSRGQGGIRRAVLGSVSESVVKHAHCPVLVVLE
jgi:nucleotide-binding universal stress UspA family protein